MGRTLRWLGWGAVTVGGLAATAAAYLLLACPVAPPPEARRVTPSPERLARGTYLAEHVAVCVDCHSNKDFSRFSYPIDHATLGMGGERFSRDEGFPGELVASNITPASLGSWSDGELVRALTVGVTPDGRALFPLMNYPAYAKLCREDLDALVTYVRALRPIENVLPRSELDFPVNLLVRTMPKEVAIREACPDPKDTVEYGQYLVNAASCIECHTQREGPGLNLELAFAGGAEMKLADGRSVRTKNITPDQTGIGGWSRADFVQRFAQYRKPENLTLSGKDDRQTLMPWSMYAGMTDEDLGAIYDFLRTVKPVKTSSTEIAAR